MGIFDFLKKKTELQGKPSNETIMSEVELAQPNTVRAPLGKVTSVKVSIDASTFELLKSQFIAFDVETTGLNAVSDRIVELGAVYFENGVPVRSFGTLVNPEREIPPAASKVNHITNDMLKNSPGEETVYPEFIEFLGEAAHGKVILCAHNARFDLNFLSNTLSRLGINAQFKYVDTLSLARHYIIGLENYQQCTVSTCMGLTNDSAHRAESDATICGKILWSILERAESEIEEGKKRIEVNTPAPEELEVCAFIQKCLSDRGADISYLRFRKNGRNYVDVTCLYSCFRFKFSKKGKYIIVHEDVVKEAKLLVEACAASEGGTDFRRAYFNSPYDLEPFMDCFFKIYADNYQSMRNYISNSTYARHEAEENIRTLKALSDQDVHDLLTVACSREYSETPANIKVEPLITRSDVVIHAVHSRCPLEDIKNLGEWEKGFSAGFQYWEKGEIARKEGKTDEAIALFDKARYNGYEAPALYQSYAITYRHLKDYDNEIEIIEEFLARDKSGNGGVYEARRDKAISLLYKKQQSEYTALEKDASKAQKKSEKQKVTFASKQHKGRTIIQFTDDGTIIKEYETVTAASNEVCISTKSIRDAAQGVQKHAGGYCWEYKE
jgi:DNA polymerase III epsilon subunit family exonuclease